MDRFERRDHIVEYLESQYLGPASGPDEVVDTKPEMTYLVGTLYPRGNAAIEADAADSDGGRNGAEDDDDMIEMSNDWHPSSAALSFIHDGSSIAAALSFGTYARTEAENRSWQRRPSAELECTLSPATPSVDFESTEYSVRVSSKWRTFGDAWMVTAAVENRRLRDDSDATIETSDCIFQVSFTCTPVDGKLQRYVNTQALDPSPEELELAFRYRDRAIYAVGHGASADWSFESETVRLDFLPTITVPALSAVQGSSRVFELAYLADESIDVSELKSLLRTFVGEYRTWIEGCALGTTGLSTPWTDVARNLISKMARAADRMEHSIDMLDRPVILLSFRLAMRAMREQMLQSRHARSSPGQIGGELEPRDESEEPTWFPFQLGFLLLSLGSTADEKHEDRSVVDLIWFPTGGGKTEAYLALAAFEMIRRRLVRGHEGGGTAVITRYTLRLLTTQQFQRAATLICALDRMRSDVAELQGSSAFTIGLWLGNETTPGKTKDAIDSLDEVYKALEPTNPFQLESCPWCGTVMMPKNRSEDRRRYGVAATQVEFWLRCPHPDCPFTERLPIDVVDEQIYAHPPTMLMATVDKFARLPLSEDAGSLLALANSPYDSPSLIIQDELHLLSGPLGTTVAVYESAIEALIAWKGVTPKVVASTATIRAAAEQVTGLFARPVELYPPSGIDADDSYFARPDPNTPGRLYLGLMPQAFTQSSAVVRSLTALLEAPLTLAHPTDEDLDAYWTVVAYHNSLRELGRTVTIARDDVQSLLRTRAVGGERARRISADGVEELTSRVSADRLPAALARLEKKYGADAVDVAASTNMLSVGIDVGRLAVMLMNGQPKTTSEYIQATSRVGRSSSVPGVVVTLFRATKPRDRSHYESFKGYHEALYRSVEPTSVTPWSTQSRHRSLAAALTILVRHGAGLRSNSSAGSFDPSEALIKRAISELKTAVARSDAEEAADTDLHIDQLVNEWGARAAEARAEGHDLVYSSPKGAALLHDFGEDRLGWPVMNSMRSVDSNVRIVVRGEKP